MSKIRKPNPKNPGIVPTPSLPSPNTPSGQFAQVAVRSAPLPHPSDLEEYERVFPGAAERIFAMAESQSSHRQRLEGKALSIEGRNSLLGIIAAWFIGTLGLLVAAFCVYTGHDTAGELIGGVSLGSLVGTFIYGTRQRRIEREQKYQLSQPSQSKGDRR